MSILLGIALVLFMLLIPISIGIYVYKEENNKKIKAIQLASKEAPKAKREMSEEQLMAILRRVMETEWQYRVMFHFKLKQIEVPDFEFELTNLVNKTMTALSPYIREQFSFYYEERALLSMVSHICQIFLLEYIDKNKFSTK